MRLPHRCVAILTAQTTENTALMLLARIRFRANVFTVQLPSDELFQCSGVMLQCYLHRHLSCINVLYLLNLSASIYCGEMTQDCCKANLVLS
jgi:hypothetical protein